MKRCDPFRNEEQDKRDAIQHALSSVDEYRELDFEETRTELPLREVLTWDDYSSWGEWKAGELKGLRRDELRDELARFRGEEWASTALRWIGRDGIPAVVLVDLVDQVMIGDGRGRVSLAVGLGLERMPVIVLRERRRAKPNPSQWDRHELHVSAEPTPGQGWTSYFITHVRFPGHGGAPQKVAVVGPFHDGATTGRTFRKMGADLQKADPRNPEPEMVTILAGVDKNRRPRRHLTYPGLGSGLDPSPVYPGAIGGP